MISLSIPTPVSLITKHTNLPGFDSGNALQYFSSIVIFCVWIVRMPPFGITSRALTARFMITCSIWSLSAFTCPSSGSSRVTISISIPIKGLSIFSVSITRLFKSRISRLRFCFRLKTKSSRVNEAARYVTSLIFPAFSYRGSSSLR